MGLFDFAYAPIEASRAQLSTVSNNLANMQTLGFKSQSLFMMQPTDFSDSFGTIEDRLPTHNHAFNLSQGALRETGRELDIALASSGHFLLMTEGRPIPTRDGRFEVSIDGLLVSSDGFPVMSASMDLIQLETANIEIGDDGRVFDDGRLVATLGVFELDEAGGNVLSQDQVTTAQGYVEDSNVDLAANMTAMMQAMRDAEPGATLLRTYNSLLGQAIQTFGNGG